MKNDQAWFDQEQHHWKTILSGDLPEPIDAVEFMKMAEPPEWFLRDQEFQYRKGFYHGIAEAADLIVSLYRRGGYVRPQEIANILGDWCNDLRRWKSDAITEQPLRRDYGTPSLKWTPWPEVKSQARERDGGVCRYCGSAQDLEGHHIEPVNKGGLPVLENILTLCVQCHRREPK